MERIPTEIDLCLFTSLTVKKQELKFKLQKLYRNIVTVSYQCLCGSSHPK